MSKASDAIGSKSQHLSNIVKGRFTQMKGQVQEQMNQPEAALS